MANNRMFMVCLRCLYDEVTQLDDCRIYIAKYYPTGGWSFNREKSEMDAFFEKHLHMEGWEQAMFGDHFTVFSESLLRGADPAVEAKRSILEIVAKATEEGKIGH